MEETDPAQILPAKKHIVETSAPGSVGPMVPPMGMPMSPHTPAIPAEPVSPREEVTADLPPAEPFGSPAVFLANHEPREFSALQPAVYGEPVVAHAALEPRILPAPMAPLEPRILPVAVERGKLVESVDADRGCCSCCGKSHDGQEDRPIDREEEREEPDEFGHDHADHHRGEHSEDRHEHDQGESDRPPVEHVRGEADREGTTEEGTVEEPDHSCACCGEDHPGLDTTDPKDSKDSKDCLPPTESDTCGADSKPQHPDGPQQTPASPTKPVTPLTPTESSLGYAVAEKDKAAEPGVPGSPRAPMAPPLAERLSPMQPGMPRGQQQSTPATPVEPKTFSRSTGPPSGSGTPPVPLQQGQRVQAPFAPVTTPAPPPQNGGQSPPPPAEGTPDQFQPPPPTPGSAPGVVTNAGTPPVTTGSGSGSPFILPGTGGYGGGTVPTDGNVGPDPNIKFDEAQYSQLIGVIAGVQGTLDDATSIDVVYLDAELRLQPTGQTWEPAVNLVTRGGRFGGSVDTESSNLEKTLKSFHAALEQAKEVFKETDDLAAYDATRFSTDYPGFGSGGPGLV